MVYNLQAWDLVHSNLIDYVNSKPEYYGLVPYLCDFIKSHVQAMKTTNMYSKYIDLQNQEIEMRRVLLFNVNMN